MAFEPLFHFIKGIHGKMNNGGFGNTYGGQSAQQMAYMRNLQKELKYGETLQVPLDKLEVIVFDIETTGFFPEKGDEIISIGAIKIKGRTILEDQTFYSLTRYEKELPRKIQELTGILNDELKEAPYLSDVLIRFFDFVKTSTLVAHHANHEKKFLQSAKWKLFRSPFKHRIVDTSFLYRIAEPDLNITRLEEFCEHNKIPLMDRHHALGDAKLTAKLWQIYIEKVQTMGCHTLKDVYERLARL